MLKRACDGVDSGTTLSQSFVGCCFLFLLFMLTSGCATTIKEDIGTPQFVRENLPVRTLNICLILDEGILPEKVDAIIKETSAQMEAQVGIILNTTVRLTHADTWPSKKRGDMLGHVYLLAKPYLDRFDICISVARSTPSEKIASGFSGGWHGVIDDIYRRYIIIKKIEPITLLHEMYHAFILSHQHSGAGIMQSSLVPIIPFASVYLNSSKYLSPADRKEVLENKWRDFNSPVTGKNVLEKIVEKKP